MERTTSSAGTVGATPPDERVYPRQTWTFYLGLSVYWFALSFIWSGMITIVMQTLVKEMAGEKKDLYLGWTLALGVLLISVIQMRITGTFKGASE